jgi:Dolichyl-phosphate-mannose-protein mannosyltransferase
MITSKRSGETSIFRWSDGFAIAAVCAFVFLACYRLELPGLYMDEVDFVNAARGGGDNTMIHLRLASVPVLLMPYLGALKAWIYAPIFRLFGVSAVTIRLPAILLAAVTLLIWYRVMRETLGPLWGAIVTWIIAVDPANLFPSRLDWGPTVLMHFFQASIVALWFGYREKPELWKLVAILLCFGLGTFDKFNFAWFAAAFVIGVFVCYWDTTRDIWLSLPRFVPWIAITILLIAVGAMFRLVWPLLYLPSVDLTLVRLSWIRLGTTLSGQAVANFIFGSSAGIVGSISTIVIVMDGLLAIACLLLPISNPKAREHRKGGIFCVVIALLIFLQVIVTPRAGGPHHYSMIFPLPVLALAFLAKSLCTDITSERRRHISVLLLTSSAIFLFAVNFHNTAVYLFHFRSNSHYTPRWSPEIYALSQYVNSYGFQAERIISTDWGLHNQLHALAPKKIRQRMRNYYSLFRELDEKDEDKQTATLEYIFPPGKSFAITFANSKETFPQTRRNFFAVLATHSELKPRCVKEFWLEGDKIYELYEVQR